MSVEDQGPVTDPLGDGDGDPNQPLGEGTRDEPVAKDEPAPAPAGDKVPAAPTEEPAPTKLDPEEILKDEALRQRLTDTIRGDLLSELKNSDEIQRHIQSEADRRLAKAQRKMLEDNKQQLDGEQRRVEEQRRRQLIESEDFESLGRLEAEKSQQNEEFLKYASTISESIERVVRDHPDFAQLGEDTIERIYGEVKIDPKASVVDFTLKLADARRQQDVARAKADAQQSVSELVAKEIEAKITELGLKTRQEQGEKGEGALAVVSGGAKPKQTSQEETYESMSDKYGRGDASWSDFKPFLEDHKKTTSR